jgi:large subunit ribosomal protein L21
MYAVIKTGGKQYRVAQGDRLRVEKLAGDVGSTVTLDEVLMIGGEKVVVGTPRVKGAKVTAEIVAQDRAKKVIIFKFRRRKNYRRKRGHRQPFTELKIIVRQVGSSIHAGENVGVGSDFTLWAKIDGVVKYERWGKDRKRAAVYPKGDARLAVAAAAAE